MSETLTRDSAARMLAAMDDFLNYVKHRKVALKKELAELESAERIYRQSGVGSGGPTLPFASGLLATRPTIKEGVVQLLEEIYPIGLTALEVLDRLNRRWWQGKLKRTSLSPQITRLKKDGKIVNERGTWKIASKTAIFPGVSKIDTGPPVLAGGPVNDGEGG